MRPRNVSHPVFTLKSISFTSFLERANYEPLIHVHHWQRCPAQHLAATSKTSVLQNHPPVWNA